METTYNGLSVAARCWMQCWIQVSYKSVKLCRETPYNKLIDFSTNLNQINVGTKPRSWSNWGLVNRLRSQFNIGPRLGFNWIKAWLPDCTASSMLEPRPGFNWIKARLPGFNCTICSSARVLVIQSQGNIENCISGRLVSTTQYLLLSL